MCGIAGLWAPRLASEQREELVRRMTDRLRHRGPSGAAHWSGAEVTLGIARLAIVGPRTPARVLTNEAGDIHAVVNGEIYNDGLMRRALRARGHRLESGPDTEVIPHLYEDHGSEFARELDGMFAAAVWDSGARRLTLVRDRAGEKPLFVTRATDRVAFASEPGALLALPWVSRDPSSAGLARYLAHGYFAGEDCAFAALRQLAPAHAWVIDGEGERSVRYWRPWDALGAGAPAVDVADAPRVTRDALERAVASRVPGDVPFGVFLSGGIDSGVVAALAARATGHRFPTFTLRMAHRGYDESPLARAVANRLGTEHHELVMDAPAGAESLERFAAGMDQPLGDPSVIPTWALARLAAQHVPVVLTGEGGDELFAGYPTYLGHRHAAHADRLPESIVTAVRALAARLRPKHHHVTLAHMAERFLATRGMRPFERHLAWFGTASLSESRALLAPDLAVHVDDAVPRAHLARVESSLAAAGCSGANPGLLAYQLLDFETYLSGDLLTKVDRATMAHGLESRAPFLCQPLVEMAFGLPESARLRGATGKWALRQVARTLLPPELLRQRKKGFSPPFSAWARGPLARVVRDRLSHDRLVRAGVLNPAVVRPLVEAHLAGQVDRGRTLWAILSLQMWAERWVTGSVAPAAVTAADPRVAVEADGATVS